MKIEELDAKLALMNARRTPAVTEGTSGDRVVVQVNEGGGRHRINVYDPVTGTLQQTYFKFCDDHIGAVGGE